MTTSTVDQRPRRKLSGVLPASTTQRLKKNTNARSENIAGLIREVNQSRVEQSKDRYNALLSVFMLGTLQRISQQRVR